jgi:hypothetical protein
MIVAALTVIVSPNVMESYIRRSIENLSPGSIRMANKCDLVKLYTNKNYEQKNLDWEGIHGMQIWDFC